MNNEQKKILLHIICYSIGLAFIAIVLYLMGSYTYALMNINPPIQTVAFAFPIIGMAILFGGAFFVCWMIIDKIGDWIDLTPDNDDSGGGDNSNG
jgi:TRAP-type C4-dicarboxylate transport system permease small subunit